MPSRHTIAFGIFYLVAFWAGALGFVIDFGLVNPLDILDDAPYREPFAALVSQPDVQELVLVFAGFIGGLLIASALCIVVLVSGPLRKNEERARPLVVILSLGILIPQFITWTRLGMPIAALSVVGILIGLVVVAALLLRGNSPTSS